MKNFFLAIIIAFAFSANAQSVAINNDGSTADNSAILDLKSNNQGVLVPRMTAAQRGLIATPATGLMVYQTDAPAGFYFYNGTAWTSLNGAAGANGTNGTNGQGVPTGGAANQVLAKINATDFNTTWVTPSGGGTSLPTQTGNAGKFLVTDGTNITWGTGGKTTLPTTFMGHASQTPITGGFFSPFESNGASSIIANTSWLMPSAATCTIDTYSFEEEAIIIEIFEVAPPVSNVLSVTGTAKATVNIAAYSSGAPIFGAVTFSADAGKLYTIKVSKSGGGGLTNVSPFYTIFKQN